jgi:hypothetical protein
MKLVFLLLATGSLGHASITPLDLGAADGPLDPARLAALSGASPPPPDRNFAEIRDGVLRVTFKEGKKVTGTGLSLHVPSEPREICDLSFRIRYPEYFPAGLHGKQLGMSGGKGYDGGRGEEARFNGDGWSVRLQFDVQGDGIRNSLYVYQQGMEGKYGNGLGGGSFLLRRGAWHDLRLRVTMQSEPAAADGRIEVWCDGNKMIDRDGVQFVRKEAGRRIDRVRLEFFPGGGGDFPDTDHVVELADVAWGESDAAEDGRGWWRRTRELLGIWP